MDVLYDDILNLANLGQVGLVVTPPWFTLLVVLLECLSYFVFLLGSSRRKHIGQAFSDTDILRFDVKPFFVQSRCGNLSRVDTLDWFEFFELRVYITDIDILMERDWCRDLEFRSRHSRRWRSMFPRFPSDLSTFPALPFDCAVLLSILVSDLNLAWQDVSNHLEYHPEAPRGRDATTAWNQVEQVPLRATPEGPKFFMDNQ